MPVSSRMIKINELLSCAVSQLLEEDVEELGMLVVASINTSRDLSVAHVFLAGVEPGAPQPDLAKKLQRRAGHYRSQLGKSLALRRIPEFQFHLETHPEVFDRLETVLDQLAQESSGA